jgi:hypothetical protein
MHLIRDVALRELVYSSIKTGGLVDGQVAWVLFRPELLIDLKERDLLDGTQRGLPIDQVQLAGQLIQVPPKK